MLSAVSVRVAFFPTEAKEYAASVPVFVSASGTASSLDLGSIDASQPYLQVELKGTGIDSQVCKSCLCETILLMISLQLSFDVGELILPSVPVGVSSQGSFTLRNHGFDHAEAR
jgi:hypothetical protein